MWIISPISFFTILSLTLLLFIPNSIEACSCLEPDEPQYCNTDFFALVYITGEQANIKQMTIRYRFKTLSIIRDPLQLLETRQYKNLHTYISSASCGVELKIGERYLIGGNLNREHDRLTLDLCHSYVEQYSNSLAVVTKEFQSLLENCNGPKTSITVDEVTTEKSDDINNKINDKDDEKIDLTKIEINNESKIELETKNDQLEREGKPIMKYTNGMTENDRKTRIYRPRFNI